MPRRAARVRPLAVAVLASGEGTTFDALAGLATEGQLPARFVLVLSNRAGAGVVERARRRGVPVVVLASKGVPPEEWAGLATRELASHGAELVVLAGFLKILPPSWVERWAGRAVNLHPALLPKYGGPGMYGAHVHAAVLASGDRETGAVVHLVTPAVDGGPVLARERIEVRPDDTPESLRARLHPVEVGILADTIRRFADGSLPLPYPERDAPARGRRAPARGGA